MWSGKFEGEESGDGRRTYRLKWQSKEHSASREHRLTEREIRGGLFIRYLIGHGKLSEIWDEPALADRELAQHDHS